MKKNIFILEKVFGWKESTTPGDSRRYWTQNGCKKVCYVIDSDFYPSSHDCNYLIPNYTSSLSKTGQLLQLLGSFTLLHDHNSKYILTISDQFVLSNNNLSRVVADAVIRLYGGTP